MGKKPDKDYHIGLAETLKMIQTMERNQADWKKLRGAAAERMVESYEKHLENFREEATELEALSKKEQAERQRR